MRPLREHMPITKDFELEFNQPKIIFEYIRLSLMYSHIYHNIIIVDPDRLVLIIRRGGPRSYSTFTQIHMGKTYGQITLPGDIPGLAPGQ
jgi:hypothetical protein